MSHCYEDYLALGRNICANLYFGDNIYLNYGFQPKNYYENYFNISKPSREESSCSTSPRKEEEEGTKGEDSSKPSAYSRFKSLFFFSSNRDSEYCDMSTPKYEKVSSLFEENRNEEEEDIHEVKCKSPQCGCIGGEVEEECTSSFFVGDLQITAQYVGFYVVEDKSFGLDPKHYYKSELDSPQEPHTEE